jgi:hypothetical protein
MLRQHRRIGITSQTNRLNFRVPGCRVRQVLSELRSDSGARRLRQEHVAEAIRALEGAGILTWCNRLKRVREYVPGLFGKTSAWRWRVVRTSNGYVFSHPASKSDFQTRTPTQKLSERKIASNVLSARVVTVHASQGVPRVGRRKKTGLVRRRGRPEGSRKVTIARRTEARQTRPHRWHDARLAETGRQKPSTLFVVADAATLVADARQKGLLWNVLGRPGLREVIVHCGDAFFRRPLHRVVDSLSERVVLRFEGADVRTNQGLIGGRRYFAVGHVHAKDVKIAVVKLVVVLVVKFAQRCGLELGLERGNGSLKHGFRFRRRAGLLSARKASAR